MHPILSARPPASTKEGNYVVAEICCKVQCRDVASVLHVVLVMRSTKPLYAAVINRVTAFIDCPTVSYGLRSTYLHDAGE